MSSIIIDLKSEISTFLKGSTIDAIIPPFIYVLVNQMTTINIAGLSAMFIAIIIFIKRIYQKKPYKYAIVGFLGVSFAFAIALYTNRASDFFIPQLLSSSILIIIITYSLIVGKPFAAWLSHLSRGWSFEWFWRPDIKPAYTEVTWVWLLFMMIKLGIQFYLWRFGQLRTMFIINTFLGMPGITIVLVGTYIYGIYRLHQLKGPGVHEYKEEGPYQGQTRGF